MDSRYFARTSDNTDNCPYWFVADRQKGGLNVTAELTRDLLEGGHSGAVFMSKRLAEALARLANRKAKETT